MNTSRFERQGLMFWRAEAVADLYMASSRLPNDLVYSEQVLDIAALGNPQEAKGAEIQWSLSRGDVLRVM